MELPQQVPPDRTGPGAMDALHEAGIWAALALQAGPPWLEQFWVYLTSHFDPKSIYTFCFPLAHGLDARVGLMVLWIGLVAEWLNVVLKWFLFGERPYWWIHESGLFSQEELEKFPLRQFPVTCETGPGSPSGHCMIPGAALWPLVTALTAEVARSTRSRVLRLIPFLAYTLFLVAMGLSRIFVLAHFPHQVVTGILAGSALGWGLQRCPPNFRVFRFFVAVAVVLMLSALALHSLATAAGIDLDWSLRLASAWCSDPAWLRPDTRPFASLCRVVGSALGLALAAETPPRRRDEEQLLDGRLRVASTALALLALQLVHRLPRPSDAAALYRHVVVHYAAGPFLVVSVLPRFVIALRSFLEPSQVPPNTN
ncbi:glucose-6-phosphatase 3-like isoform X1 [Neopelma chrysocephalum]|uniref:glucose-6-phosphatase 3-like isoform X1 n=1 Tax=Neopelma chrysocephalum TaxID=114329 RepID=UPI000FCD3CEC|nr:glucose-6-phosphatase 3-like isoform X1 [Neopelma chrysocephalum]XP_027529462.1 glucose-6-phosphatase 3-like isoform X1 [Neopelma chrysocephalum]